MLTPEPSTVIRARSIHAASPRGPARLTSHGSSTAPAQKAAARSRIPAEKLSECSRLSRSSGPIPCDVNEQRARYSTVR